MAVPYRFWIVNVKIFVRKKRRDDKEWKRTLRLSLFWKIIKLTLKNSPEIAWNCADSNPRNFCCQPTGNLRSCR